MVDSFYMDDFLCHSFSFCYIEWKQFDKLKKISLKWIHPKRSLLCALRKIGVPFFFLFNFFFGFVNSNFYSHTSYLFKYYLSTFFDFHFSLTFLSESNKTKHTFFLLFVCNVFGFEKYMLLFVVSMGFMYLIRMVIIFIIIILL